MANAMPSFAQFYQNGLRLQFLGGLSDEQIYKIYEDKEYATMIANSLLVAMQ